MRSQNSYARQPQLRRNSPNIDDNGEADDRARVIEYGHAVHRGVGYGVEREREVSLPRDVFFDGRGEGEIKEDVAVQHGETAFDVRLLDGVADRAARFEPLPLFHEVDM